MMALVAVSDSHPNISDYRIRGGGRRPLANYHPLRGPPQTHIQHNAAAC